MQSNDSHAVNQKLIVVKNLNIHIHIEIKGT